MTKLSIPFTADPAELASLGLDADAVAEHGARLRSALLDGIRPEFKVLDACRVDNGGLVPLAALAPGQDEAAGGPRYAAFVPAAGAASRYSQPLFALTSALEQGQLGEAEAQLTALAAEGATRWPLPDAAQALLASPAKARTLSARDSRQLLADLQLPKALMPCVAEGMTFLQMKDREHAALADLSGEVFVTPPGLSRVFAARLPEARVKAAFLEQGPALSTIRFYRDGRPYREADGRLSPVPAGHGALATLFPEARRQLPGTDGLFIRNIDNVMGTGAAALAATNEFLSAHRRLLSVVRTIRSAMARGDWAAAATAAQLGAPKTVSMPSTVVRAPEGRGDEALWALQLNLFHTPVPSAAQTRETLRELYARPVNLLGQVPNTGKDVGGTPCFVRGAGGAREKVCIEVPHVSEKDRQDFLADPAKATHFNPVFCAVEVPLTADWYGSRNHGYWLLSEKTYRGEPVVYCETVLYELLGNSTLANCVFAEVPRRVFNPHKALKDALGRTSAEWLG